MSYYCTHCGLPMNYCNCDIFIEMKSERQKDETRRYDIIVYGDCYFIVKNNGLTYRIDPNYVCCVE